MMEVPLALTIHLESISKKCVKIVCTVNFGHSEKHTKFEKNIPLKI